MILYTERHKCKPYNQSWVYTYVPSTVDTMRVHIRVSRGLQGACVLRQWASTSTFICNIAGFKALVVDRGVGDELEVHVVGGGCDRVGDLSSTVGSY